MTVAAILDFWKMLTPKDWIKIFPLNFAEIYVTAHGGDLVTKNRNMKLIHVTSSNERQERKGVDLRVFETNLVHSSSTTLSSFRYYKTGLHLPKLS